MRRRSAKAWLLAVGLSLAACGAESGAAAQAEGVVRGVDAASARITIEHGDIPDLMEAMTMTFEVSGPELLEGVAPGDAVSFRVRYADGKFTVTSIEPR
jgi:Cu/Ag efflux protein CusF